MTPTRGDYRVDAQPMLLYGRYALPDYSQRVSERRMHLCFGFSKLYKTIA